jgi:hypothetical protein
MTIEVLYEELVNELTWGGVNGMNQVAEGRFCSLKRCGGRMLVMDCVRRCKLAKLGKKHEHYLCVQCGREQQRILSD